MLNLKGFFLSNSTTFPGFHSPLASKARPAAINGTPAMQWFYGIAAHVAIRLGPPEAAAPNPTRVFGYGYKRAIE